MVPDLGRVVEDAAGRLLDHVLQDHIFHLGTFGQVAEIGDIGLMVFAVVILKRLLGDMRLQRVLLVGQGGKLECHGVLLLA